VPAERRQVLLIEDCAQANGATFRGKPLGSFGDLATWSFQLKKAVTCGEGGLIVTDCPKVALRIVALHDTGYVRDKHKRVPAESPVQGWGQCNHMSELAAAFLLAQLERLDTVVGAMRARARQLYAGLGKIPGVKARQLVDPEGDNGAFVLLTFPSAEICDKLVPMVRAAGVRPPEGCLGSIRMEDWGLHIYYHNISLVNKHGTSHAGRPWNDPLNAWATDISYKKGTLPQLDDLVARSTLITVAPALTEQDCENIIAIYQRCALSVGMVCDP